MQIRYVGPFPCWLPDAPQVGDIAPGSVVDVPDALAAGLLAQDTWQPVAEASPADDAGATAPATDDAPPATRKRSSR